MGAGGSRVDGWMGYPTGAPELMRAGWGGKFTKGACDC